MSDTGVSSSSKPSWADSEKRIRLFGTIYTDVNGQTRLVRGLCTTPDDTSDSVHGKWLPMKSTWTEIDGKTYIETETPVNTRYLTTPYGKLRRLNNPEPHENQGADLLLRGVSFPTELARTDEPGSAGRRRAEGLMKWYLEPGEGEEYQHPNSEERTLDDILPVPQSMRDAA